jgi:plastocyanin domain-containing protein
MSLFVNLVGLVLMALVVWWFWLSHRKSTAQALTLHFDRRDPSPCAEQVIFQGLDTSAFLETGKTTTLTLDNLPAGKHRFTCQMQMYQGTLIVD